MVGRLATLQSVGQVMVVILAIKSILTFKVVDHNRRVKLTMLKFFPNILLAARLLEERLIYFHRYIYKAVTSGILRLRTDSEPRNLNIMH